MMWVTLTVTRLVISTQTVIAVTVQSVLRAGLSRAVDALSIRGTTASASPRLEFCFCQLFKGALQCYGVYDGEGGYA